VREAVTVERREKERMEYMKNLRRDAYIRLAKEYEATVGPLIFSNAPVTGATSSTNTPADKPADANKKP
jgi:hypothetical protein